jgi:hypothetical protein
MHQPPDHDTTQRAAERRREPAIEVDEDGNLIVVAAPPVPLAGVPIDRRDLPRELLSYQPETVREFNRRPKAWNFPEVAQHGAETIVATTRPKVRYGPVLSFCAQAGCRLLLEWPELHRIRAAHDRVLASQAEHLLGWFDKFSFSHDLKPGERPEQDVSLSPMERGVLDAVTYKIRLPQSQALTLGVLAALIEFPKVNGEVRLTIQSVLHTFLLRLQARAVAAERKAEEAERWKAPENVVTSFDGIRTL